MIGIKLVGGLGNQMFQYAIAAKLAQLHSTDVVLDISWFNNKDSIDTDRFFELDQCQIKAIISNSAVTVARHKNRFARKAEKLLLKRPVLFSEQGMRFQSSVLSLSNNTVLAGYYQSEYYFADIRSKIINDFQPSYKLNRTSLRHLDLIKKSPRSVSMHVRRGDYVTNPHANKFHGLTGLEYYKAAIKRLSSVVKGELSIFVFSDDLDWCRNNLKFPGHKLYFVDGAEKSFDDIWLMSHCRHNIIANSSFSWWGAWLNLNPEKVVIAPKQWFKNKSSDTRDLIPKDWIKL